MQTCFHLIQFHERWKSEKHTFLAWGAAVTGRMMRKSANTLDSRAHTVIGESGAIAMSGANPAWQSLGESNPSFQVENLTS